MTIQELIDRAQQDSETLRDALVAAGYSMELDIVSASSGFCTVYHLDVGPTASLNARVNTRPEETRYDVNFAVHGAGESIACMGMHDVAETVEQCLGYLAPPPRTA